MTATRPENASYAEGDVHILTADDRTFRVDHVYLLGMRHVCSIRGKHVLVWLIM